MAGDDPSRSDECLARLRAARAQLAIMASPLQQLRERLSWRRIVLVGVSSACSTSASRSSGAAAAGADDRVEADAIVVLGAAQYDGEPRRCSPADSITPRNSGVRVWRRSSSPLDRICQAIVSPRSSPATSTAFAGIPDADLLVITDGIDMGATRRSNGSSRDLDSVVLVSDPYTRFGLQIADEVGRPGFVD